MSRPILSFLALSLVALVACKPRQQCPEGLSVQLLANAGPDLNPCPNGAACAVNLRIYELKSGADLDDLDYAAIHERGAEVFGQNLVKPPIERALFPEEHRLWNLELDPNTTHVVTVALYGEVLGDAWYHVFAVPRDHPERACEAAKRKKPIGDPCLYLAFDSYEINGGRFPPAGFDVRLFETTCAPIGDTQPKKRRKRKRRDRSLPSGPPSLPPAEGVPTSAPATAPPSPPSAPGLPSGPAVPR
ncbi:MAG: type VI secretion system lipoprotein TssJ [Myxococcales bacterium]|nr:type VI secretion system lipoprotein TssJ [Myxococcales bacterium]